MRVIRGAVFEEFVRWYLARERRKRKHAIDLEGVSAEALAREMRQLHPAKLRPWFERARWSVVSLDNVEEAMALVCVDSSETRRNRLVQDLGPNNRLARTVIAAAYETGYFHDAAATSTNAVEAHYRRDRIESYRRKWPELRGEERVVLCSLNADERSQNPSGSYYLHDGFGRLLAFLYAVVYEARAYAPVEAFLAEERG